MIWFEPMPQSQLFPTEIGPFMIADGKILVKPN